MDEATTDDLEEQYELRLRGKKADLVEVANVLHSGHHLKSAQGHYTPPDHRMIKELLSDLYPMLDVEGANAAMKRRLQTDDGELIVGETVSAELVGVEANEQ